MRMAVDTRKFAEALKRAHVAYAEFQRAAKSDRKRRINASRSARKLARYPLNGLPVMIPKAVA